MSLARIVLFDLRYGLARVWRIYLAVFASMLLLALSYYVNARVSQMDASSLSLGDYTVSVFTGMKKYIFNPNDPFNFPAAWMLVYLLASYLTLNYPYRDLQGVGKQVMAQAGSRLAWWVSKCVWVIVTVMVFYGLSFLALLLFCQVSGGALSLSVSSAAPVLLGFERGALKPEPWSLMSFVALLPLATSALCLLQLVLSLVLKPLFGYVCSISLLFFSSYFQNPLLFGNYLMAARSSVFVSDGVPYADGIIISIIVIVTSMVIGAVCFGRMDIVEKEQ